MTGVKHYKNQREKRRQRVRSKVFGTRLRPRLNVFRSAKHIYAQIIDDEKGYTRAAFSDLNLEDKKEKVKKVEVARLVGENLGRLAKDKGIKSVVFDRGGFKYQGRVKALAEGARSAGLEF